MNDKDAAGATYEDAETIARYAGLRPDTPREDNDWNRSIAASMS